VSKPRRGKTGTEKTVSYGWVGRWRDGTLGWFMPQFACACGTDAPSREKLQKYAEPDTRFTLCKITVEQVRDKNGKPINRRQQTLVNK